MLEIPPTKHTDAEDVVWGLQTADALWKRGERIDALVWLRRAAQAAGDANDDDRALELARYAAELTEWMATHASSLPPIAVDDIDVDAPPVLVDDDALASDAPPRAHRSDPYELERTEKRVLPPLPDTRAGATARMAPYEITQASPRAPVAPPDDADGEEERPSRASVPPAETVHAGMFDPWADQAAKKRAPSAPMQPSPVPVISSPEDIDDEVVTSVRPQKLARQREESVPISAGPISVPISVAPPAPTEAPPRPAPAKPPPLPPRAAPRAPQPPRPPPPVKAPPPLPVPPPVPRAASEPRQAAALSSPPVSAPPLSVGPSAMIETDVPPAPVEVVEEQAALELSVEAPPPGDVVAPDPAPPPGAPTDFSELAAAVASDVPPLEAPPVAVSPPAAALDEPPGELVLDTVEAFADLPDDARLAFAAAAKLHPLAEGEEIGTFALAYVVNGTFDVAATVVDAPAVRLAEGAVLRARGTTDEGVPMRLICAQGKGVVATWSDAAVDEAFRSIPWVEEDLRAAADRVQTLVGITIGPLGERLDVSIREQVVSRLTMRPLIPAEVIVNAGQAVPGLLLVGVGEVELVKDDKVVGVVGSGEFLFPTEVLGAGSAPATARAGAGGALVMFGDRGVAQELLVTCPPLLEVFAGM